MAATINSGIIIRDSTDFVYFDRQKSPEYTAIDKFKDASNWHYIEIKENGKSNWPKNRNTRRAEQKSARSHNRS